MSKLSWLFADQERSSERRRHVRRKIKISSAAYLDESKTRIPVTVFDMSETGAAIRCDEPDALPDAFVLFLRGDEEMRRYCTVVRRGSGEIGVRFRYR